MTSPFEPRTREILNRFAKFKQDATLADRVKKDILLDNDLRPTIAQIVLLWYTSTTADSFTPAPSPTTAPSMTLRFGTAQQYFSGLAWSIIGAHPPGRNVRSSFVSASSTRCRS